MDGADDSATMTSTYASGCGAESVSVRQDFHDFAGLAGPRRALQPSLPAAVLRADRRDSAQGLRLQAGEAPIQVAGRRAEVELSQAAGTGRPASPKGKAKT